ncbi:MAG: hypothetical protein ABIB79_05015 [archaeon]
MKKGNYPIMKPKLIQKTKVTNNETAKQSRGISNKNTSRFFSYIYATFFGGKVRKDSVRDIIDIGNGTKIATSPDVVLVKPDWIEWTEIKASSTRSCRYRHTLRQIENYSHDLIFNFHNKQKPLQINHAFFRFGHWTFGHIYRLNKSEQVKMLSENTKALTIIPFNFALALFYLSQSDRMNHSSDNSSFDFLSYKVVRGGDMTKLHKGNLESLIGNTIDFGDLFLDKLEVEKTNSPIIKLNYYGRVHKIDSFPITKYTISKEDYHSWIQHFANNHERILRELSFRNIYKKVNEMFGD